MNYVVTRTDASAVEDAASSPITVCMLFLETVARNESRVMRDATTLVEAGYAVTIVDIEKDLTRPAEEDFRGVHFKHIFMRSWYTPTRFKPWYLVKLAWAFIRSTIRLLQTPADIYHVHNERALPACYIAARLCHKPLIFDVPELTLSDPRYARWRRLSVLSTHLLARMLPYCAGVIATSPFHAQEIRKLFRLPEVTLVRNVPAYRAVPKSNRLRQNLGLSSTTRIALYQGNLQPNRGLHVLVRAAKFLKPDIVIVMMGRGSQETLPQLTSLITSEGVADRVKFIPPVPYEELLDWTASADLGLNVLPPDYSLSIRGCLPNKFFEYLMAGLPVLSSELDAIGAVIRMYNVGQIISSLAPANVAAAINEMLDDQENLARMHRNALEAARSEFCWEKESQNLFDLYHKILSKPENLVS
jgi:glycosyltransferase involved in cell wall biosynthesis